MRMGTPGFVGERLTEAREARGLSQTSLAELTDLKVQSISQYESGKQSPSPEALSVLIEKLNMPERYFLRSVPGHSMGGVKFRCLSAATKGARAKAMRRFGWLKESAAYLREFIDLPTPNIPDFRVPPDPTELTSTEIEKIADECRVFWGLGFGPIKDMVLLLENCGCIVSRTMFGAETLDAFSQWDAGIPYVILGADKNSSVRSRFDAAHELGHLILHAHLDDRQINSPATHKILEAQAHRFAGAFLLPERSFSQEVWAPTLDAFLSLKKYWKCAVAMMVSRCEHLGMLNEEQVKRARINISRKGWRTEEPLDNVIEIEQPKLLARSARLLIDEGLKDRESMLSDLRLNGGDAEDLLGLPRGYFKGLAVMPQPSVKLREHGESTQERTLLHFPGTNH
jgi:Zn-dependent peptidase ImmA (M78 family)/transcriptional regulator with XRE-family HTH domain